MTHSTQGQHTQQLVTLTNSMNEANSFQFCPVLLLLTFCLLLLPLWESVIVLCFDVRYFMSVLVLQSS